MAPRAYRPAESGERACSSAYASRYSEMLVVTNLHVPQFGGFPRICASAGRGLLAGGY